PNDAVDDGQPERHQAIDEARQQTADHDVGDGLYGHALVSVSIDHVIRRRRITENRTSGPPSEKPWAYDCNFASDRRTKHWRSEQSTDRPGRIPNSLLPRPRA